jgi:hypothetical protein
VVRLYKDQLSTEQLKSQTDCSFFLDPSHPSQPTPQPNPSEPKDSKDTLGIPAIIGIVIGSLVALIAGVFVYRKYFRRK